MSIINTNLVIGSFDSCSWRDNERSRVFSLWKSNMVKIALMESTVELRC